MRVTLYVSERDFTRQETSTANIMRLILLNQGIDFDVIYAPKGIAILPKECNELKAVMLFEAENLKKTCTSISDLAVALTELALWRVA